MDLTLIAIPSEPPGLALALAVGHALAVRTRLPALERARALRTQDFAVLAAVVHRTAARVVADAFAAVHARNDALCCIGWDEYHVHGAQLKRVER